MTDGATSPKHRKEVRKLVTQARADLRKAEVLLNAGEFDGCAFYSQQSVEKAMKALWIICRRERPPATHDLTDLGRDLSAPEDLATELFDLTREYTSSRYPGAANCVPAESYTRAIAERALGGRSKGLAMDRTAALMEEQPLVRRFLMEALPRIRALFAPQEVWLFGSRVRGDWLHESDLDVIIVAESFREISWFDRYTQVAMPAAVPGNVELLCYTPAEFAEKRQEWGIVEAAVSEGIRVV